MAKIAACRSRWRRVPVRPRAGLALAAATTMAVGVLVNVVAYAPPALANPQCFALDYDFVGYNWTPAGNDVEGVRAPIKMRTDGELCSNSNLDGFTASWIAIEQQNGNGITQIGFDHHWDSTG